MQLIGLYKTGQSPGIVAKVRAPDTFKALEFLEGMLRRYASSSDISLETKEDRCGYDRRGYAARRDSGYLGTINLKLIGCRNSYRGPSEHDDFPSAWSTAKTYSLSAFFNMKEGESSRDDFYERFCA